METRREADGIKIYRGYNPALNEGRLVEVCECGKTFSTEEALEAHRKSKGYACAALIEEKREEEGIKHGGRTIKCPHCAKLFKTREAMNAHIEKKHPVDPDFGRRMSRGY